MALSIKYKFPFFTTPMALECRWPYIQKPDTQFGEPGEYKIDLPADQELIDALSEFYEESFKEFLAECETDKKLKGAELKRLQAMDMSELIKEYTKDDKTFTYLRAKTKYKPAVYDSRGQKAADMPVYGGDKVKVQMVINPWCSAMGAGLSLRLRAVQVIERGEYGSGGANPFSDEGSGAVNDGSGEGEGSDSEGDSGEQPPFASED